MYDNDLQFGTKIEHKLNIDWELSTLEFFK